jgi:hypothetical protein
MPKFAGMRLEAFLTDLLYDHDCVIIPGFGGLVANYRPARLNRVTHVIKPPSKHVGFNRNLTHNDGLLVAHISLVTGKSYAESLREVEETVAEYQHALIHGERVSWQRIGLFFRDRGGNMQFVPEDQENFLPEAFGLTPVQLRPLAKEIAETPAVPAPAVQRVRHTGWWKAAAAVAFRCSQPVRGSTRSACSIRATWNSRQSIRSGFLTNTPGMFRHPNATRLRPGIPPAPIGWNCWTVRESASTCSRVRKMRAASKSPRRKCGKRLRAPRHPPEHPHATS